jgi:predicted metal-dependent hydrolase
MNTESREIVVGGLRVQVVRKGIKNLHLGVYPPSGRVRVAAPVSVSDNAVRLAVVRNLGWIKRQRARFETQVRQPKRAMAGGETHFFLGRRYRLRVVAGPVRKIVIRNRSVLELQAPPGSTEAQRQLTIQEWYRRELKRRVSPLLAKWQARLGVQASAWGIRRMRTRWGTSNPESGRILLNLELVKKPPRCLEYLIVHELVHFLERHHNDRFVSIMDTHLPRWRMLRAELNAAPLAHEDWNY